MGVVALLLLELVGRLLSFRFALLAAAALCALGSTFTVPRWCFRFCVARCLRSPVRLSLCLLATVAFSFFAFPGFFLFSFAVPLRRPCPGQVGGSAAFTLGSCCWLTWFLVL